jgi:hypothetical protein
VDLWLGFTHACREVMNPEIVIEGSAGRAVWHYEEVCTVLPVGGPERSHRLPGSIDSRRVMFVQVLRHLQDAGAAICTAAMAEPHTAFIEAIHASAPVQPVSPDLIDWFTPAGGTSPVPAVRGLEAAMRAAAARHSLLREQGFVAGSSRVTS